MRKVFSLFDTDYDGYIMAVELWTMMWSLRENPTQAELKEIIKCEEISGTIDFPLFVDVMKRNLKAGSFHVQLRDAFKALDKEGTNKNSARELHHILTNVGEKLEPSRFNECIREIKVGSDGNICYEIDF